MSESLQQKPKSNFFDLRANFKGLLRVILALAVLVTVGVFYLRLKTKSVELHSSIQNLPVSSFRGIPLAIKHDGIVSIRVNVLKGNDVDVYLVTNDQLDRLKRNEKFVGFENFSAQKIRSYLRSARLRSGTYYLIVLDKTLGVLSQSSSDVQVQVKLET